MNDANPYAPPKAKVADPEPTGHGLTHRSVLMMVVFTIITLGIYYGAWWFRRRPGLNRLHSSHKVSIWPPVMLAVLFVASFAIGILSGVLGDDAPMVQTGNLWLSIFQLIVAVALLVQSFRIKHIIEDHVASDPLTRRVQLSGVMTFFFSIYYLQWAINRYVVPDAMAV